MPGWHRCSRSVERRRRLTTSTRGCDADAAGATARARTDAARAADSWERARRVRRSSRSCVCVVFWIIESGHAAPGRSTGTSSFGDLFANTTTNGGDMGAHVWWPWFLTHHWFPQLPAVGLGARTGTRVSRSGSTTSRFPACDLALARHDPVRAVQRRVQARHRLRPAAAPGERVLLRHAACGRRGRRRRRSRSRRPARWCRPATTGRSTAATSRARSRASSPSRSRSRSACSRWARSAKTLDTGQAAVAARGADRGGGRCRTSSSRSFSAVRGVAAVAHPAAVAHVATRVAGRRRRRRAHRGVVAAAARAHTITQSMRYRSSCRRATASSGVASRRCSPVRSSTRSKASCAALGTVDTNAAGEAHQAAAVAAVVDLAARRRRDRRGRLLPAAFHARAARARDRARRAVRRSGPSTRSGTRASCRSGCSRGDSSPRWARPRSCAGSTAGRRAGRPLDPRRRPARTRAPRRGSSATADADGATDAEAERSGRRRATGASTATRVAVARGAAARTVERPRPPDRRRSRWPCSSASSARGR